MKPRVDAASRLTIVLFIFSLLLAGCVSSKQKFQDDMKAQGVEPLASLEMKKLLSDATMYNSGGMGEYSGYYSADGKIQVTQWWLRGESIFSGRWKISEDGAFCEHFEGYTEEERCYSIYPGKTKTEFTMVQISGPLSEYFPNGILHSKVTQGR